MIKISSYKADCCDINHIFTEIFNNKLRLLLEFVRFEQLLLKVKLCCGSLLQLLY